MLAILAFLRGLSQETCARRFCSGSVDLEADADLLAFTPERDRHALVATTGPGDAVIAHACYGRVGGPRAEFAVVVADAFQCRGLAGRVPASLMNPLGRAAPAAA